MENLILSLMRQMLNQNLENKKYSSNPKTAFYLNLQYNHTLIFLGITLIQILAVLITFALGKSYIPVPFILFFLYHILSFRSVWIDIENAKNYYKEVVRILPFHAIAAILAMAEMLFVIVLVRIGISRMIIILIELTFYLLQLICFLFTEKCITKYIEKNQVSFLHPDEEPKIIIKTQEGEIAYSLEDYFPYLGEERFLIMTRNFHVEKSYSYSDLVCKIGNHTIYPPVNDKG